MRAHVEIKQKFKNNAQLLQVFQNSCDLTLIFPFCGLYWEQNKRIQEERETKRTRGLYHCLQYREHDLVR